MMDDKNLLLELIEKLNEEQLSYTYRLLSQLFSGVYSPDPKL